MKSVVASLAAGLLLGLSVAAFGQLPTPVVDDQGHEIALAKAPVRIVSLAPSITELLFAIDLGERVVGVTEYCNYPEAASQVERVAGYSTLNAEKIISMRPDLVIAARGNDPEGLRTLRDLGIPVFGLANNSVADIIASLPRLGALTGQQAPAARIAQSLRRRVDAVAQRVSGLPRPLVMWGYIGDPIYTAGQGSAIDDVITRAGGDNAGRRAGTGWPQVSLETVVGWSPEVWLVSLSGGMQDMAAELERLREIDGWRDLPAIRDNRLVHIDGDLLSRAGPRLVDALEQLAAALHPPPASPPSSSAP